MQDVINLFKFYLKVLSLQWKSVIGATRDGTLLAITLMINLQISVIF